MTSQIIQGAEQGPLCPYTGPAFPTPQSEAHQALVARLNEYYVTHAKDDDNEFIDAEHQKEYAAMNPEREQMRLFRVTWSGVALFGDRRLLEVESYYWQCHTCGFVLPATSGGAATRTTPL